MSSHSLTWWACGCWRDATFDEAKYGLESAGIASHAMQATTTIIARARKSIWTSCDDGDGAKWRALPAPGFLRRAHRRGIAAGNLCATARFVICAMARFSRLYGARRSSLDLP